MDFSLFGVPMIGADICGFIDDTTEELCARWIEVGAFYPFSRNHNALGSAPQELYLWSSVAEASKKYLGMRYQLIPYMYTQLYQAHVDGSTAVATSLWMNFPTDPNTAAIDRQFMVGDAVLISPVLDKGVTSVNAYFPQGKWYNFEDFTLAVDSSAGGVSKTLNTPLTATNVHVRGGKILPLQAPAMTTSVSRQNPFTLLVALCPGGKAFGSLFWDDGEQIDLVDYVTVEYAAETYASTDNTMNYVSATVSTAGNSNTFNSLKISKIVVTGSQASLPATALMLNGMDVLSWVTNDGTTTFDQSKSILTFDALNLTLTESFTLQWK